MADKVSEDQREVPGRYVEQQTAIPLKRLGHAGQPGDQLPPQDEQAPQGGSDLLHEIAGLGREDAMNLVSKRFGFTPEQATTFGEALTNYDEIGELLGADKRDYAALQGKLNALHASGLPPKAIKSLLLTVFPEGMDKAEKIKLLEMVPGGQREPVAEEDLEERDPGARTLDEIVEDAKQLEQRTKEADEIEDEDDDEIEDEERPKLKERLKEKIKDSIAAAAYSLVYEMQPFLAPFKTKPAKIGFKTIGYTAAALALILAIIIANLKIGGK